ncbi:hypothetical protein D3C81_1054610 [compost metagenome]
MQHRQAIDLLRGQLHLPAVQRDFPIHRPITGNVAADFGERQGQQAFGKGFGGGDALGGRNVAAALAQLLAEGLAGIGSHRHRVAE